MPATFETLAKLNEAFNNFSDAMKILKDDDAYLDRIAKDVAQLQEELESENRNMTKAIEEYNESAAKTNAAFALLGEALAEVLKPEEVSSNA